MVFILFFLYAISINNGEINPGEAIEMLYLGESGWKAWSYQHHRGLSRAVKISRMLHGSSSVSLHNIQIQVSCIFISGLIYRPGLA